MRGEISLKNNMSKFISYGGVLTTLTVVFQGAPIILPTIGLAFSPLSTLPIALSAYLNIMLSFIVFLAALLILLMISLEEATILLFTTGLLGVIMGTVLYRKGILLSILLSSIALTLGMVSLTYIIDFKGFEKVKSLLSLPLVLLIFLAFSLVYSTIWNISFKRFIKLLNKHKIINI